MGKRLTGFDYSRPYFYMVAIKCLKGVHDLSEIVAPGRCQLNAITRAFVNCIRHFHEECLAIAAIECFSIMPDHIHLLIRILERELLVGRSTTLMLGDGARAHDRSTTLKSYALTPTSRAPTPTSRAPTPMRLEAIVELLMQALEGRYREVTGKREQVFDARWHDWIVSREGQLAAFTRYIRENPERRWLRLSHPEYFRRVNEIEFLGRKWYGYGNAKLLQLPVLESMRYSRQLVEGGEEWNRAVARAERIGPGGAGVGTFMSPCEKACGHALGLAGGRWIVLSPEGFGERWHPARQYERFCAEGRMLFLSLWPAMAREPTRAELYDRCHQMGDIIVDGLRRKENRQ